MKWAEIILSKLLFFVGSIILLSLMIGIPLGGYQLFNKFLSISEKIDAEVWTALVATCGTIIVSVFSVLMVKHLEKKNEIRREHIGRKTEIYEKQIAFWFRILFSKQIGQKQPADREVMKLMSETTQDFIAWAGDDVLAAQVHFRSMAVEKESSVKVMSAFEELLFAIREDLGHSNSGVKKGDILKLFITDWDMKK